MIVRAQFFLLALVYSIINNAYRLNTASHNILKESDLLDR